MTCSVCLCEKIACLYPCLQCLVAKVLSRTWNIDHADSMTVFLCQTRENWPHQHPWDLSVPIDPCDSTWNHEFSHQTSPPRASRFPDAHPRKFASDLTWISDAFQVPPTPVLPDQQAWFHCLTCFSASSCSATRRTPSVRCPLGLPEESTVQEKRSCAEEFVSFLLSSDHIASAVSVMSLSGFSASLRQCHSLHKSWESWAVYASVTTSTPDFAFLCPYSYPSKRTRDRLLSWRFPSST